MAKLGDHYKAKEKELAKEEQFEVSSESSAQDFVEKYKNLFIGGFVALLLLVVGVMGWNYYQGMQSEEAAERMFQAIFDFEAERYDVALNGNDSLGTDGFLDIIGSYGSSDAGNLAKYYAGISNLKLGNASEGISDLESFSKGNNQLSAAAYMALGFAYENQGNLDDSAGAFEDAAAASGDNDQTRPLMLFHAGRVYESMGSNGKALTLYKKIKSEHPQSTEAASIDKYIGRVE